MKIQVIITLFSILVFFLGMRKCSKYQVNQVTAKSGLNARHDNSSVFSGVGFSYGRIHTYTCNAYHSLSCHHHLVTGDPVSLSVSWDSGDDSWNVLQLLYHANKRREKER